MWLILRRNIVFLNICPILLVCTNKFVNPKKFMDYKFSNLLRKTNILSISEHFWATVWDCHFLTIKRSFQWILLKMLQGNRKYSLAVCGPYWGETLFFIYLSHFSGVNNIVIYTKSKLFSWFYLFKLVKKNNLLSISELLFEISIF